VYTSHLRYGKSLLLLRSSLSDEKLGVDTVTSWRIAAHALRSSGPSFITAVSYQYPTWDAGPYHDDTSPSAMLLVLALIIRPSCVFAVSSHRQYGQLRPIPLFLLPGPPIFRSRHGAISYMPQPSNQVIVVIEAPIWHPAIELAKQQSVVGLVVCYHLPIVSSEVGGDHGCKYKQDVQFETKF
jgi:hypothetical protein